MNYGGDYLRHSGYPSPRHRHVHAVLMGRAAPTVVVPHCP